MKKLIKVTQDHINEGQACNAGHCPVALAILDIFPTNEVTVNQGSLMLWDGIDIVFDVPTPPEVRDFIISFDLRGFDTVKPFEFTIDI